MKYRKFLPGLKQINYRQTYLKQNIRCLIHRTKILKFLNTSLKIYDTLVKRVKTSKSPGVFLNKNLSWKSHMDTLALNISKSIGIIFTQPVFSCLKLTRETLEQM